MSNAQDQKRKALGKGLSALLPARPPQPTASQPPPNASPTQPHDPTQPATVAIGLIDPNPSQPRTVFEPEKLDELAQSIRANGIIQPLIVRKIGSRYELIAGERRLRAAKLALLPNVPVVIQEFAESQLLEVALIENIQRADLNAIELAIAYDRLNRELGYNHDEIGRRTGKDRSSIANTIRLLRLPQPVQQLVSENRLSMGQARAILALQDEAAQIALAEKAVAQGLSTRQVEALVRNANEPKYDKSGGGASGGGTSADPKQQDPNVKAAAEELERVLGTRVRIVEQSELRGRIEIEYYAPDDLMRIYELITGKGR